MLFLFFCEQGRGFVWVAYKQYRGHVFCVRSGSGNGGFSSNSDPLTFLLVSFFFFGFACWFFSRSIFTAFFLCVQRLPKTRRHWGALIGLLDYTHFSSVFCLCARPHKLLPPRRCDSKTWVDFSCVFAFVFLEWFRRPVFATPLRKSPEIFPSATRWLPKNDRDSPSSPALRCVEDKGFQCPAAVGLYVSIFLAP